MDALPYSIVAGEGSVWVATYDGERGQGAIARIDPATDRVVDAVPIDGFAYNLAAGDGAAWVSVYVQDRGSMLLRIDAGTNAVTGRVHGVTGPVAVDPSGVWAVGGDFKERDWAVVRMDPSTLEIDLSIPVSGAPFDMVTGAGSIWVLIRTADGGQGPLLRIDPTTGRRLATIHLSNPGIWIAADDAGVWTSVFDIARFHDFADGFIDSSTNVLSGRPAGIRNFRPFAVAEGRVWFIAGPGEPGPGICGLNVVTREVDVCAHPSSIADLEGAHDPAAFEPVTDSIWVGQYEQPWVTRIDVTPAS